MKRVRSKRKVNNREPFRLFTKPNGKGDRLLFFVILGLILFGALMIFSGSVPVAVLQEKPPYQYFIQQIEFIIMGLVLFAVVYNIDYHIYPKLAPLGIIVTLILLVVVLFTPAINDTHRWLDIGIMTFQVSDLAKLTLVIYFASWLSKEEHRSPDRSELANYLKYNLGPFLGILGLFCVLILIEPNLSTTILIGVTALSMYFLSGQDIWHNIGTIGVTITLALSGLVAGIIAPYRFARIKTFIDFLFTGQLADPTGKDYQLRQILIAVGTGKILGEGFGQSKQKFAYLTDTAFSDTIFAVFAEEFGFLGSIVLVSVYIWIMFRGFKIAKHAPDKLGSLLAIGVTIWISFQTFIHFAVNVGLIPLTGMPLPFLSYGGSSLLMTMAGVGILLNVSRYSKEG